jgi:hypothetical protein
MMIGYNNIIKSEDLMISGDTDLIIEWFKDRDQKKYQELKDAQRDGLINQWKAESRSALFLTQDKIDSVLAENRRRVVEHMRYKNAQASTCDGTSGVSEL